MNKTPFDDAAFIRAENGILRSRDTAIDLLEELVQIPTVNPPGEHYLECALLIAQRLREFGFEPRTVDVPTHELQRLGHSPGQPRPSVVAVLGPGDASDSARENDLPTLHFHGHYDVVPAESADSFRLVVKGDEARGRGAADMKGGLVSMLLALAALRPLEQRLRGRVLLSIVPDEETGGSAGTDYLFRAGVLPPNGIGMLMPEPTNGLIWHGNRGAVSLLLTVRGKMAHVALQHQGRNAFEGMLELGGMLRELKSEVEARSFGNENFGLEGPPSVLLIGGVCRGGVNFNVVPKTARFSVDRRFHPSEHRDAVEKELESIFRRFRRKGWRLDVEWLQRGDASLTESDTPIAQTLAEVVRSVDDSQSTFALCPGILETRFFLRHGTPGLAYGPGELELSHGPNERIRISKILEVARIYARTAWAMLGPEQSP